MIQNKKELLKNFFESRILFDLAEEALNFLQPNSLISHSVKIIGSKLIIQGKGFQGKTFDLSKFRNIYLVGAGKATYSMAESIHSLLSGKIKGRIKEGFINVPVVKKKKIGNILVNKAGHPFPDKSGLKGAKRILEIAKNAGKNDLLICLISGGGSSMLPLPAGNLTLKDKIDLTKKLLKSSANIHEINAVRKHISLIKSGRLAASAKGTVISLYISDVLGDKLETIASGPTITDKTTISDALKVLKKYKISDAKIINAIKHNESPKTFPANKVFNFIIGSNSQALRHLKTFAEKRGFKSVIKENYLKGEAKNMAKKLLSINLKPDHKNGHQSLLIAGGETVVNVKGKGQGGRNQELSLSALKYLKPNFSLLSLATDGVDGITPEPIAGAIVSFKLKALLKKKNLNIEKYLKANDSYHCLKLLNCLLKTGPSGTNVGDIVFILHDS